MMQPIEPGVGSRLQHTQFGPGVIVGVRYATYLISFIHHGIKEVAKLDPALEEIMPSWGGYAETVPLGDRWRGGSLILQPYDKSQKPKEMPIEDFFHKVVMLRDRLRVLEQNINSHKGLSDEDKVNLQQYITRCYGSLTSFNLLFRNKEQYFVGEKGKENG